MTNTAFEVTVDDLWNILNKKNHRVFDRHSDSEDVQQEKVGKVFDDIISPEMDRIENAALKGDEMDEQTTYAYEEIDLILWENNLV